MLTPETAAQVAKDAGLSLADAAAIRALADDEDQARKIAAGFAGTDKADSSEFIHKLFGKDKPSKRTTDLFGTKTAPHDTPPAA